MTSLPDPAAPPPVRVPRSRPEDLPLCRKTYGLIVLTLAGGFLLGLCAERYGRAYWPLLVMGLTLGVAGLMVIARAWILQPIDRLLRAIEMMRRTDRPPEPGRLPTDRGDEIGRVAAALHDMAVTTHRERTEAVRLRRTLDASVASATRSATAHLRVAALRDPLTELGNRRYMDEHVPALFELCRVRGEPMSCMVIDLDDFKGVNDGFGHAAGDTVLKKLADLLRACTREQDVAIRLGGDEFVLWLPGVGMRRAAQLGELLRKLFKQQARTLGPAASGAGVSVGLASTEGDTVTAASELLALADDRLYAIKHNGKGRVYGLESATAGVWPKA